MPFVDLLSKICNPSYHRTTKAPKRASEPTSTPSPGDHASLGGNSPSKTYRSHSAARPEPRRNEWQKFADDMAKHVDEITAGRIQANLEQNLGLKKVGLTMMNDDAYDVDSKAKVMLSLSRMIGESEGGLNYAALGAEHTTTRNAITRHTVLLANDPRLDNTTRRMLTDSLGSHNHHIPDDLEDLYAEAVDTHFSTPEQRQIKKLHNQLYVNNELQLKPWHRSGHPRRQAWDEYQRLKEDS